MIEKCQQALLEEKQAAVIALVGNKPFFPV